MSKLKKVFHYFVYINLITGFFSALYMVFVVYAPKGHNLPLWSKAIEMDQNQLIVRRLYALEAWIIFGFLALYFILSEKLKANRD